MTEQGADLTRLLTRLSLSLKRAVSPKAACILKLSSLDLASADFDSRPP